MIDSWLPRMQRTIAALAFSTFLAVLIAGCGDDNTPTGSGDDDDDSAPTAAELTAEGWESFESGTLSTAKSRFREALDLDAAHAEAHTGLGWTLAREDSLQASDDRFDSAIAGGHDSPDPYAGKAPVLRAMEPRDNSGAIDAANEALDREIRYVFDHDPGFDWMDLRLILAQAYVALTEYDSANAQVDSLGRIPIDPQSEFYVRDLIAVIDTLGREIGN